jgi:hypothetical protein
MFFGSRKRQLGSALGIAGLIAMAFGIIWIAAVFDTFVKVPADMDRTAELVGDYTLPDQAFLEELQGNATVGQLLASGGRLPSHLPSRSRFSRALRSRACLRIVPCLQR